MLEINHALPQRGLIYELGCGYGTLAYEIAKYNPLRQVVALDTDRQKISNANDNYKLNNLTFIKDNVLTYHYTSFQGVVLSDFLHHIDYSSQEKLIKKLAALIHKKGVIIIKEIDDDDGWRKMLSRLWDRLLYPNDRIFYRSKKHWLKVFQSAGLNVQVTRAVPLFPGSTYLYVCTKTP